MGPRLHWSARATTAVRRALQQSQEGIAKLAERDALNPNTVTKRKLRTHVHDAPMGPKHPRSTVLTRAALHRGLQRHGISRLPHMAGENPVEKQFKA